MAILDDPGVFDAFGVMALGSPGRVRHLPLERHLF